MPLGALPLNHFDYFSEIEETFVRCRGTHLLLSPADWLLIQGWKEQGIPLHVVLRGIENVFKRHARQGQALRINSLRYCQQEVETLYRQRLNSHVGVGASDDQAVGEEVTHDDTSLPFPRSTILAHLDTCRAMLLKASHHLEGEGQSDISVLLSSVAEKLSPIVKAFTEEEAPAFSEHEAVLDALDIVIAEAVRDSVPPGQLAARKSEVETQLSSHQSRMSREDFARAVDNVLLRHLREELWIPQLTLFSL
jgi:hypothetical protein